MIKNEVLSHYINPDFVYRFNHGPNVIKSREQALREGLNCEALAHLALRDLTNVALPSDLRCYEMYNDTEYFRKIETSETLQEGDLFWFGQNRNMRPVDFQPLFNKGELTNWDEYPVKHMALFTGEHAHDGNPLLLHATYVTGTNSVWSLPEFNKYPQSKKLYGVTRLK